jgi:dipeptidyl aminopeptidase/acylaminoacyl peptidase
MGFIWTPDDKAYWYVGPALTSGYGASMTWSPDDPTLGMNIALQAGRNFGVVQIGFGNKGKRFVEGGVGTPGISLGVFKIYGPYNILRRR